MKGPEYADLTLDRSRSIYHEMRLLEEYGGRMHFTSGETFSSTKLSHFLLAAPDAAQRDPLLRNDRVRFRDISEAGFTLDQLKRFITSAAPLRVCVIGETIIDEWVDVSLTNLSTQSRCLAGVETGRQKQVGGAGIIARHLASFVHEVDCVSNPAGADWPANVRQIRIASGELVETRFVDADGGRPVFKSKTISLSDIRLDALPDFDAYDLVLIADFGHGLLEAVHVNRRIADRRRATVAAMAQVNSSNYGYNLPLKYVGADYYSLNRTEAELCLHERHLPLDELVVRSVQLLKCGSVSVTDGASRCRGGTWRHAVQPPFVERQRRGHDRLRRCTLRPEQPGRPRRNGGADGRARREHRRSRDDAAPMQRERYHRAGVHDHRKDRHLMALLVTGGCGYIGTRLTEALLARTSHDVTVLDTAWFGNYLPPHPRLTVRVGDIRALDGLDLSGYDTIFHLAGIANDPSAQLNPYASWEVNVLATMRLADRATREGVRQFVFPSSGAVYGIRSEPRSPKISI